ncbi:MAG: TetR/AcrR family transcriptional regulator [Bacteroidota bacterium]
MTTATKYDLKLEHLLNKGIELIWQKGYHASSVKDIVQHAEVPKGSFYYYFESKEDFVVKAIEKYFEIQQGPMLEVLTDQSTNAKDRLMEFYRMRIRLLREDLSLSQGCMACNLSSEIAEHSEPIRLSILNHHNKIKDLITSVIHEAQEAGQINRSMSAADFTAFIEDAGKGAMTTMKEMKSAYPLDNHMNMITLLLQS